ncbi:XRE family transcriptional regulator [Aeromonas sp. 55A]|uniref:XRE family transcriptional regulator n=1 Tax=Aeromonas sp. 55A TaxID=3452720 RepID=UPI003F79D570
MRPITNHNQKVAIRRIYTLKTKAYMESDDINHDRTLGPILPEGIGLFNERLKELIGHESVRAFGRRVGISDTTIRKYLSGETEPTISRLVSIAVSCEVALEWLATGEGPKQRSHLIEERASQDKWELFGLENGYYKDEFDEEYALVDGYHVTVSTGYGAFNGDDTPVKRRLAFRRKWLKYRGFKAEQLKVVFAKGDSMEPTIASGDSLLINLAASKPIDGEIFVVRLGEELYAKRIQKRWDGAIELLSDNKEYKEQVIPASELERLALIGQVVWIGKDVGK